jgi:hypothetical protein
MATLSTYDGAGRTFYERHKVEILAKEKVEKRWKTYYQTHKEEVKKRNLERYYAKRVLKKSPPPPPPDQDKINELNAIILKLQELLPTIVKSPRKKKVASVTPPEVAPPEEAST